MMSPPSPSLSMPLPMEARHLLAGGLAGVTANALLHPLDTIRARVTVHQHVSRNQRAGGGLTSRASHSPLNIT
jgi:hypothetical protein